MPTPPGGFIPREVQRAATATTAATTGTSEDLRHVDAGSPQGIHGVIEARRIGSRRIRGQRSQEAGATTTATATAPPGPCHERSDPPPTTCSCTG